MDLHTATILLVRICFYGCWIQNLYECVHHERGGQEDEPRLKEKRKKIFSQAVRSSLWVRGCCVPKSWNRAKKSTAQMPRRCFPGVNLVPEGEAQGCRGKVHTASVPLQGCGWQDTSCHPDPKSLMSPWLAHEQFVPPTSLHWTFL